MANDTAMTPVFSSSNHDAEMEAMAIKGLLDYRATHQFQART